MYSVPIYCVLCPSPTPCSPSAIINGRSAMGPDRGMQAVVTASAFTGLALLFVVMRCISRFCVIKQAGTEDYLAIIAILLSISTTVIIGLREHPNHE